MAAMLDHQPTSLKNTKVPQHAWGFTGVFSCICSKNIGPADAGRRGGPVWDMVNSKVSQL
jgi:hypothetical protein